MSYGAASRRRCTLCARSISVSNWRRHVRGAAHYAIVNTPKPKKFKVTYRLIARRIVGEFECEVDTDTPQSALNIVRVSGGWPNARQVLISKGGETAKSFVETLEAKEVP